MRTRISALLLSLPICAACTAADPELGTARLPLLNLIGEQKLLSQPLAGGDNLGRAASASGDSVIFGAPLADRGANSDAGAAYVYLRSNGTFAQQSALAASDGLTGDMFGQSVAIDNNLAAVGAHLVDLPGKVNAGAAYVFFRGGGTFQQEAKLTANDSAADDAFGYSIGLSGDTAIVGAYLADPSGKANAGAAYVFVRNGTTWTMQTKLTASDGAMNDAFGYAVAISGDTAVVSSLDATVAGKASAGAAYVFTRSGTTWSQQAKLVASDPNAGDEFGSAVAISGDTAVVTSFLADLPGKADAGAAYVFARASGTWGAPQKLVSPDAAADDRLGLSAAILKDTIVLGAPRADRPGLSDAGAVYVYTAGATGYGAPLKLVASDGALSDSLGRAVAAVGDVVFAGASAADPMGLLNAGAGYAFTVRHSTGDACGSATDCTSGYCVGAICCESACTGGTCKDGICTPASADLAVRLGGDDFGAPPNPMEPTSLEGGCGCRVGGSASTAPLGGSLALLLLALGLVPLRRRD